MGEPALTSSSSSPPPSSSSSSSSPLSSSSLGAENEGSSYASGEMQTQRPENASSSPQGNSMMDIFSETKKSLRCAARKGDWRTANEKLGRESERLRFLNLPINDSGETLLHIAVEANQVNFVKELVKESGIDLLVEDKRGNTAYCIAVAAGAEAITTAMEARRPELARTPIGNERTPAYVAASFGHAHLAPGLYRAIKTNLADAESKTRKIYEKNIAWIFFSCIDKEWFDLSKEILRDNLELKLDCEHEKTRGTALHMLASKPSSFSSATESQGIWKQLRRIIYCRSKSSSAEDFPTPAAIFLEVLLEELLKRDKADIRKVFGEHPENLLVNATKLGNFKFLTMLIDKFPFVLQEVDNRGHTIFHIAIMYRQVDIFRIIHQKVLPKERLQNWVDKQTGNNVLHLAADIQPDEDRLLQMQKELLFYQELERFMPRSARNRRNKQGKTPKEVFSEKHKDLLNEREKWMKKNANYCLVVATLIVAVLFPSAYTVPDIKNVSSENLKKVLTALSGTVSLAMALSAMSMVMFFSLLISHYAEEDFISSLPCKFKTGLVLLVLSLLSKMVYFSIATIVTNVHHESLVIKSIVLVPQSFSMIAVILFIVYHLIKDVF